MDYTHLKELLQANNETREYPDEADKILEDTAKSGIVRFSWKLLKPLLRERLQRVLDCGFEGQECKDDEGLCDHLLDKLDTFENPPFTIQRVCELITEPRRHYKRIGAYMRAMERNLLVVATQEPDLTWMKSPRLTQLLGKPVQASDAENLASSPTSDSHHNGNTLTPNSDFSSDSPGNARHPARATTDMDPARMNSEHEMNGYMHVATDLESARVCRKRKNCERDEFEGTPPPPLKIEEPRTILQEADSTTTVGADQEGAAKDIDSVPPSLNSNTVSGDVEMEENAAKRLRSSSPEAIVPSNTGQVGAEGLVSSALEESGQVHNKSTGQSESLMDVGNHGN